MPGAPSNDPPMNMPVPLNCKTLMIPSELRGGLIGKGGAEINKIRNATQCKMDIQNSAPGDPFFSLQIVGNVTECERLINERLDFLKAQKKEREPPWAPPKKNQWLMEKLQAEGCAPERIAYLVALAEAAQAKRPGGAGAPPAAASAPSMWPGYNPQGAPKEKVHSGVVVKPDDWYCPGCNDLQFARNTSCRLCHAPKPGGGGMSVMDQGMGTPAIPGMGTVGPTNPNDWHCPNCGDVQFARNAECRKCGTSR